MVVHAFQRCTWSPWMQACPFIHWFMIFICWYIYYLFNFHKWHCMLSLCHFSDLPFNITNKQKLQMALAISIVPLWGWRLTNLLFGRTLKIYLYIYICVFFLSFLGVCVYLILVCFSYNLHTLVNFIIVWFLASFDNHISKSDKQNLGLIPRICMIYSGQVSVG